jgi:hypothetical protein
VAAPKPLSDDTIIFPCRLRRRFTGPVLLLLSGLWLLMAPALAQTPAPRQNQTSPLPTDVPRPIPTVRPDTAAAARQRPRAGTALDTSLVRRTGPDSLKVAAGARKGGVETTVKYAAKDSIRFVIADKKAILYDDATVDYGDLNLKAAQITVDYSRNLLTAEGAPDSTGKVQGRPVFKNGAETYQAGRINYNFKTRKGKIADAVTQQGEGYVHAEVIKKNQFNEIYGRNGRYTTCNLEHPHFFINASKMKVIPGQKVVTGPFNLVIGDIPTPLGFLFGYFPSPSKNRASGIIIPTYGQSADRGYFLRNGGYYWAANDNIGVRFTGDFYAGNAQQIGGARGQVEMQYIKRYAYQGLLSFEYSWRPAERILRPEGATASGVVFPQSFSPKTLWLRWNHSPIPRPGGGRFSASVSAGSQSFNQQNAFEPRRFLTPAFSSNISYSKQLRNAPINYSVNLSQTQNVQTGVMNFILPDFSAQVARQYPYQWLGLTPRKLYEQFSIAYSLRAQNTITNEQAARQLTGAPLLGGTSAGSVIPIKLSNLDALLRNSQNSIQHEFQIQIGSYTVLKHLNLTPSISYNERWYFKELDYSYNSIAEAVRVDTLTKFSRVYNYSGGLTLGTNIYGTVNRKGTRKIQALRHKITPNLNYNFAPARNPDYFQDLQLPLGTIRDGQGRLIETRTFSRYQGFLNAPSLGQRQSAISFTLQNAVEMKVRNKNDTTGNTPFNKVDLIKGLDFSTGYNFEAESFKLQPLVVLFRTEVAKKLSININSSFDFYQRDTAGQRIDKYLFNQERWRLARLTGASLNLNYQFNPAQNPKKKSNVPREVAPVNDPMLGNPNPINPYEDYVDFEIPWEMTTGFTMNYTDPGVRPSRRDYVRPRAFTSASLNLGGSVKLTNNMRVGYTTNYDFINKTPAFTSLDIFRDLHCWQITGNWRPFRGYGQGYFITIAAKSSLLQDLKLNRNRTFLNY